MGACVARVGLQLRDIAFDENCRRGGRAPLTGSVLEDTDLAELLQDALLGDEDGPDPSPTNAAYGMGMGMGMGMGFPDEGLLLLSPTAKRARVL